MKALRSQYNLNIFVIIGQGGVRDGRKKSVWLTHVADHELHQELEMEENLETAVNDHVSKETKQKNADNCLKKMCRPQ